MRNVIILYELSISITLQDLVELFLDLNEKHGAGLLTSAVRPEDVIHTIELLLSDLGNCSTLLEIAPVYKRQQESWDKVLQLILSHLSLISLNDFNLLQLLLLFRS